ncbi:hypothetical protein [Flavobacterium sp.]|uniref:hypothetical protein n=1 Tax=Flavobacterium sp. TaxID=239 RepID=UPI00262A7AD6|nr:hypothetical protein [Flavobacterium sp.]
MDRLKKILIVLFIITSSNIWAQKDTPTISTSETVYLHLNATSFVSGETLFYKLYCLNPEDYKQSKVSKVAYLELIGVNNQVLFKHKLFLTNGIAQGDFFIPSTIKTGTYKLLAYTKWMQNKLESKSFESEITIINPFQSDSENKISSKNSILKESTEVSNSGLTINLDKKKFTTRELINLKLSIQNELLKKGNYSLSVKKVQDLPAISKINITDFKNSDADQKIVLDENNYVLPELRGEIISGKISSKDNLYSVSNISVSLSIPGKSFTTKLVKTNADGKFYFSIDKAYFDSNIIIQVADKSKEELTIYVDDSFTLNKSNLKFENDYTISSDLKSVIEEHSIASQVENTYYTKKADTLAKINYPTLFYEPFVNEYILDNYNRFPTIKETIIEVVKEVNYNKNDGKYTLRLNDYDPNIEINESPLVLIDGLVVQDINELFEYKASDIYKICTINTGYTYGNKLYSGLISFITKKQDFESKLKGNFIIKRTIDLPVLKKNYFKPNYADKSNLNRIPDYRYQLLWLPELDINTSNISFYTSDKIGTFEIVIEGFSDEGIPVYLKEYFDVE